MWGSGAQTFASKQLCSHREQCYKAPVRGKISLTRNGAVCDMRQTEGTGSEQGGKENMFLLLAAQLSSSQPKYKFQLDDKVYSTKCLQLYIQTVPESQTRNLEEN